MNPPNPDLVLAFALLIISAFFSAAETAFVTLSPARVRALVESKAAGATLMQTLKNNHHRTLISILITNNILNIAAASITTVAMTQAFGSAAVGIATAIVTVLVIVLGEVIPKSLGVSYPRHILLFMGPILWLSGIIYMPILFVMDVMVHVMLRLFGGQKQAQVTNEELIAMATIGAEEGSIDDQERELIENVLEFNDIRVEDIMTPRVHVSAVPESATLEEAAGYILNEGYSRIPIYRDTIDNIVGIAHARDFLKNVLEASNPREVTLRQVQLHTPLKVAHTTPIHDLFHQFKTQKTHMAIVIDEHGGTDGIITMEDLLEEIVGDIEDEEDTEDLIRPLGEQHFELSGRVELDELSELTGLEFEYPEYKTVSFLMAEKLGHLPKEGESLILDGWELKVTKMLRNTILKLELRHPGSAK